MASLHQKIAFLSEPAAYPHHPAEVTAIETHMSWIFLAGERVYKLKKPVSFPFLDFSTLEKRRRNCAEEFVVNREMAPETYLRILPLTVAPDGTLALDGGGRPVEWLIEMQRLPDDRTLESALEHGHVERGEIVEIAEKLGNFYVNQVPCVADGALYIAHLETEQAVNRHILRRPEFRICDETVSATIASVDTQFAQVRDEIRERIAAGCIVEGHGDLRPEHIYLLEPVEIIDRLEFDRSMRILDPYDEMAYLGLECRIRGIEWAREVLIEVLDKYLDKPPSPELMRFYSTFRPVLRARICIAHLLDDTPMTPEIWPGQARRYLDIAAEFALKSHSRGAG